MPVCDRCRIDAEAGVKVNEQSQTCSKQTKLAARYQSSIRERSVAVRTIKDQLGNQNKGMVQRVFCERPAGAQYWSRGYKPKASVREQRDLTR